MVDAEKKLKVTAIVQARMDSARLPGKVLMDISGYPMLQHIIDRLAVCASINKTVVATSTNDKDNAVEEFCRTRGIPFYRGSERDVLDRYYQAASIQQADIVVRVTADNPLIDPKVIDNVIDRYIKDMDKFDLAGNAVSHRCPIGFGVEVFSFSCLEKCRKEAKKDYQKEHVTVCVYENTDKFRILSIDDGPDLSGLRLTVDEEADIKFVREIYKRLYREGEVFGLEEVLNVIKEEPELKDINSAVKQFTIAGI